MLIKRFKLKQKCGVVIYVKEVALMVTLSFLQSQSKYCILQKIFLEA
jgi:hypothetical protein